MQRHELANVRFVFDDQGAAGDGGWRRSCIDSYDCTPRFVTPGWQPVKIPCLLN